MATRRLPPELRATIAAQLRDAEQRFTTSREALLAVLATAGRPLTIPEIVASDDSLAASSVYRNVVALQELGIVHRVVTDSDFQYYELADALTEHHHHLLCTNCGSVDDVTTSPKLERSLHDAALDIARRTGFHARTHRFDLIGLCQRCA